MTSLARNVTFNLLAKLYLMATGVLLLPLYVRYLGIEAFGLVAFAAMVQAWFQLLDLGLTPTLAREVARHNGGATDPARLRKLFGVLQILFLVVAVLGALALVALAGVLSTHWLKAAGLPAAQVRSCLRLIAILVALRWMTGFYSGLITGFERMVWLSVFSVAGATARCVLVVPAMVVFGANLDVFFGFQLAVAALECAVVAGMAFRLMGRIPKAGTARPDWAVLMSSLRFSLGLAFATVAWVAVTQTDKLLLSKLLPLDQYACYTMAVVAASGVLMLTGPIGEALLPRLARICAQGEETAFMALYREATQVVCLAALPATAVLVFWGGPVVWAWTGNPALVQGIPPVLALYAGGNAFLTLAAFPYYLQFARGDLRLHVIGTFLFVALLIPALLAATPRLGMAGAGWTWLGVNALSFLLWVPLVHSRMAKGIHLGWLGRDIGQVAGAVGLMAALLRAVVTLPGARGPLLLALGGVWAMLSAAGAAASPFVRGYLRPRLARGRS